MQTTPTTVTTRSFAKKVSVAHLSAHIPLFDNGLTFELSTVWIGPLVVKELKRIVESSEIVK